MGWDVVQIGLKHDLPVDDPFATARKVAERMNRNVRLLYDNFYEYDVENNVVSTAEGDNYIELGKFKANDSNDYIQMKVSNYQAKKILESVKFDKLKAATFSDDFSRSIIDGIEDSYELYELEDRDNYIRIFQENVDLDVSVVERWRMWECAFHGELYRNWLYKYRLQIYQKAKMFGCKEVIICSDQGPTQDIYEHMDFSSEKLKEYAVSRQYLKEQTWINHEEKIKLWREKARQIMFSDYFRNKVDLAGEEFVDVIYDDFNGLK